MKTSAVQYLQWTISMALKLVNSSILHVCHTYLIPESFSLEDCQFFVPTCCRIHNPKVFINSWKQKFIRALYSTYPTRCICILQCIYMYMYLRRDESCGAVCVLVVVLYLRSLLDCVHKQKTQGGAVDRCGQ